MDRNASAHSPLPRPRFHARKLIIGIALLFSLACVIALGTLFNIAHQLDHTENNKSAFYADKALQQRLASSRQFLSSYAVWDAAYQ